MELDFSNLSLAEKEDTKLVVELDVNLEDDIIYELCLVGKILKERTINFLARERTLLSLWRPL